MPIRSHSLDSTISGARAVAWALTVTAAVYTVLVAWLGIRHLALVTFCAGIGFAVCAWTMRSGTSILPRVGFVFVYVISLSLFCFGVEPRTSILLWFWPLSIASDLMFDQKERKVSYALLGFQLAVFLWLYLDDTARIFDPVTVPLILTQITPPLTLLVTIVTAGVSRRSFLFSLDALIRQNQLIDEKSGELILAHQKIKIQESHLREVIDLLPVGIIESDAAGNVILANRQAEVILGREMATRACATWEEAIHRDDLETFRLDREEGPGGADATIAPFRVVRGGGAIRWVSARSKKMSRPDASNGTRVDCIEDITEKRNSEVALMHGSKMSALGEMAGGIAHEINTPLSVILGKTGQIKDILESDGLSLKNVTARLSSIEEMVARISKIIRGLIAFSRKSDDEPMESVRASQIVEDTLMLCGERLKIQAIEVRVRCDGGIVLNCRPTQISQILINLMSNACDAIEELSERWIAVDVERGEQHVTLSVTDSGRGICEETVRKMMEPFYTTKEVGRGTGLGLSISSGIAARHHGCLRYDRGCENTRFVLELPA